MEHAQVAVAGVAQQAAAEIAQTEERLTEWQAGQASRLEQLASRVTQHEAQIEQRLKETTEQLSSILSRLAPPPENPQNPQNGPSEAPPLATPTEPEAPPRRKAHRWI
jgi:ABC-type transporter Mla subunit MlaD